MSKILIISVNPEKKVEIENELLNSKKRFIHPIVVPKEYEKKFNVQLLNAKFGYHCQNIYEISDGNYDKKEFDKFITIIKCKLLKIVNQINICIQWNGEDCEEINTLLEKKVINLSSYQFPEDEFEFEFNVDYEFIIDN